MYLLWKDILSDGQVLKTISISGNLVLFSWHQQRQVCIFKGRVPVSPMWK